MNAFAKKLVVTGLSLFLLAYVGYQAYLAFYSPVTTQRATIQTIDDVVSASACIVRSEKVITSGTKGILDYTVDDGEKVSVNGTVANVYRNSAEAENERQIRELKNKIAQLELSNVEGTTLSVDIDVLNEEITEKFSQLSQEARSSNVEGIGSIESEFLNLLNEKQIATGTASNFDSRLDKLKSELKSLKANQSGKVSSIKAPVSGYFESGLDGLEGKFGLDGVLSITPTQVNSLLSMKARKPANAVGKVLTSYEWYLVFNTDESGENKLAANAQVSIRVPLSTEEEIPAVVAAKNKGSDGRCAVVLKSCYMSADIAAMREADVEIVAKSYTGIKVSDRCIYIVGKEKGVYILIGNTAKFRKLDITYAGDGFVISAVNPTDDAQLQLYDQVIVGGRNLYDGKIVK